MGIPKDIRGTFDRPVLQDLAAQSLSQIPECPKCFVPLVKNQSREIGDGAVQRVVLHCPNCQANLSYIP